jgi:hypothetical protein
MGKRNWYSTFRLPFLPSSTEVDFTSIFTRLITREDFWYEFLCSSSTVRRFNVMYGSNSFQPKGKGKIHPTAGHEGLEGEERHVSIL